MSSDGDSDRFKIQCMENRRARRAGRRVRAATSHHLEGQLVGNTDAHDDADGGRRLTSVRGTERALSLLTEPCKHNRRNPGPLTAWKEPESVKSGPLTAWK